MTRDPLAFFSGLQATHGDLAYVRLGPRQLYLASHPDDIREVLVTRNKSFKKGRGVQRTKVLLGDGLLTSEGEFHKRQHRLAQPAFHRERIMAYGQSMVSHAERASSAWKDGEELDMWRAMMRLTLSIAGETLFGSDVESEANEIGDALSAAVATFPLALLPFSELLEHLPLPMMKRFRVARARLDATIYRIIDQHRASGEDRGDLLSMLALARDVDGDGGQMSDTQLRDEAMTILLAGHETTANALSWTWFLLSRHPEAERRFHTELDDVLAGRAPAAADAARLPYTRMVFAESMRLFPPAWAISREALEDIELRGFTIPAGAFVVCSQWVVHHDARWFREPDRFVPERWSAEETAARPKLSYFPFGAGARTCIGEQFAWMEGVLLLAAIGRRWRPRLSAEARVEPRALVTLRPRFGMPMQLEERTKNE